MTLLAACSMGGLSAYLAYKKSRNPVIWFLIGFFFGLLGIATMFLFSPRKLPQIKASNENAASHQIIHGPSDKFWYYLNASHQQVGPMSRDALETSLQQGKILPATYVWNEELPDWKPLKEFILEVEANK